MHGRKRKELALLVAGVLALAGCGGDAPAPPSGPRLVVLYATCTLNRSFIAPYAPGVRSTPELARFADESVVFERHVTEAGQSGTAFASLFTGTQAYRHGVYYHPNVLPEELYTLTEAFADAGWDVWHWNGHPMTAPPLRYGQGVPAEQQIETRKAVGPRPSPDDDDPSFSGILSRLRTDPDYRALVVVNFSTTHSPYHRQIGEADVERFLAEHPDETGGITADEVRAVLPVYSRERLALQWDFPRTVARLGWDAERVGSLARVLEVLYRATVHRLDTLFGRTLDALRTAGLWDESVVAFTSDHGETLYRDNQLFHWTHGFQLAPEVLDVPLILHAPGVASGRFPGVTRSIDVFPTLAGLARVPLPPDARIDGIDLSPALRGETEAPVLVGWSHTDMLGPVLDESFSEWELARSFYPRDDPALMWVRAREGDLVCLWRNVGGERFAFEVYDLASDPEQRADLWDPEDERHRELARLLQGYKELLVEGWRRRSGAESPSTEEMERSLRSLGYVR